jgi:uncharacterized protein (TIGR00661 family)
MNILYSVQATGNGHISRAMELLPYLKQYGNVDIFLSGANSSLELDHPIKYRSKGFSLFYTCEGKLNYKKTFLAFSPLRIRKEVKDLPVEKYDLILNDFECITAMACAQKKIPSINFGHQASFLSDKTPRPTEKNKTGEWILKNYARASYYIGLHFQQYDNFIFPPVIKKEIADAEPDDKAYYTVYLPSYCEHVLEKYFHPLSSHQFQVFSFETKQIKRSKNISFIPVDKNLFNGSLINCTGIITGGGFETPAEALKLKKELMVIPIKGQYEQQCNVAALEQMGIRKLGKLDDDFQDHFENWSQSPTVNINYDHSTQEVVEKVMKLSITYMRENKSHDVFENEDDFMLQTFQQLR